MPQCVLPSLTFYHDDDPSRSMYMSLYIDSTMVPSMYKDMYACKRTDIHQGDCHTLNYSASAANSRTTADNAAAQNKIDSKGASLAKTISESEIDRIFTNSSALSPTGVADLCAALCTVYLEELPGIPAPRLLCMQGISGMAYYSMDSRTRLEWAKNGETMNDSSVCAMTHGNRDVGMYAIDALRQLASRFLEKDEMSTFPFPKSFPRPFETCYARAKSLTVRELMLSCVSQIALARASDIKSGGKSLFVVLALKADDRVKAPHELRLADRRLHQPQVCCGSG